MKTQKTAYYQQAGNGMTVRIPGQKLETYLQNQSGSQQERQKRREALRRELEALLLTKD